MEKIKIALKFVGILEGLISLFLFYYAFYYWKFGELESIFAFILFPIGLYFLIAGTLSLLLKKAGWIMNLMMFSFLCLVSFILFVQNRLPFNMGLMVIFISCVIVCLLLAPKVKKIFKHE